MVSDCLCSSVDADQQNEPVVRALTTDHHPSRKVPSGPTLPKHLRAVLKQDITICNGRSSTLAYL